jgi:putative hemolysin
MFTEIAIILFLILLNGFFALSEIALVSSKKSRIEQSHNIKGARIALRLLDDSENFLSAIQVGITLIGIVTGMYGGINLAGDLAPYFENISFTKQYAHEISLSIIVFLITYISIVIGELVPKTIALSNPEKIAVIVAPMVYYFSKLFYPFVRLLSGSTSFINKILGIKKLNEQMTESELRHMIKVAYNEGVIEKEQNVIHEKVFFFSDKRAKHLMTHRTSIEWIDISKSKVEIQESILKAQHSRVLCCNGNLDKFTGVLQVRDYFRAFIQSKNLKFETLINEPLIVPENADAQKVLDLIRLNKTHICVVVNEYGGLEGLITLHDIIENIVGEIPEEGETDDPDVFVREDKSMLVNGDAPLEVLINVIEGFQVDYDDTDYATVAGFVLSLIDKIPQTGDCIQYEQYTIEIIDMDGNKIDKVLIKKNAPE